MDSFTMGMDDFTDADLDNFFTLDNVVVPILRRLANTTDEDVDKCDTPESGDEAEPDVAGNDGITIRNTLRVYGTFFVIVLLVFSKLRRTYPRIYNLRNWIDDIKTNLAADQHGFIDWMYYVFMISDSELQDECGMDAICYARVLEFGLRIAGFGCLNALWLIPLYGTAKTTDETRPITDNIKSISISHVPEGSYRMIGTTLSAYLIFGFIMYNILKEFEWFIANRHRFLAKALPRNYSVYVRCIPKEYRSNKRIKEFFETSIGPGSVLEVNMAVTTENLKKLVAQREAVVANLEHAINVEDITGVAPTHMAGPLMMDKVDSIQTYYEELTELNQAITDAINKIEELDDSSEAYKLKQLREKFDFSPVVVKPNKFDDHASQLTSDDSTRQDPSIAGSPAKESLLGPMTPQSQSFDIESPTPEQALIDENSPKNTKLTGEMPESPKVGMEGEGEEEEGEEVANDESTSNDQDSSKKSSKLGLKGITSGAMAASKFAKSAADAAAKNAQKAADMAAKNAQKAAETAAKNAQKAAETAAKNAQKAAETAAKNAQKAAETAAKNAQKAAETAANAAKEQALAAKAAAEATAGAALDGAMGLIGGQVDGIPYSSCFVTFKSLRAKQAAIQMIQYPTPFAMEVIEAPHPEDVFWQNVGKGHRDLQFGKLTSYGLTAALCFFWTIPMTFISSLSSLDGLRCQVGFIDTAVHVSPWLGPVLEVLAPLLIVAANEALKVVLEMLSMFEGPISGAEVESLLFSKLASFMIIQTFFVSSIAGTLMDSLNEMVRQPETVVTTLATALPSQSTFFIQILLVDTFVTMSIELLRVIPLGMAFVRARVGPNLTEKERNTTWMGIRPIADPDSFEHANLLAGTVLYFMVFFVYAVLAPITCFFMCICFLLMGAGYRHQFIHIYPTFPDSGGLLWVNFIGMLPNLMLMAQVTIIGLMGLKKSPISSTLMIPLIVITILFKVYIRQKHFAMTQYLPSRDCSAADFRNNCEREMDYSFVLGKFVQPELTEKEILPENFTVDRELAHGPNNLFMTPPHSEADIEEPKEEELVVDGEIVVDATPSDKAKF